LCPCKKEISSGLAAASRVLAAMFNRDRGNWRDGIEQLKNFALSRIGYDKSERQKEIVEALTHCTHKDYTKLDLLVKDLPPEDPNIQVTSESLLRSFKEKIEGFSAGKISDQKEFETLKGFLQPLWARLLTEDELKKDPLVFDKICSIFAPLLVGLSFVQVNGLANPMIIHTFVNIFVGIFNRNPQTTIKTITSLFRIFNFLVQIRKFKEQPTFSDANWIDLWEGSNYEPEKKTTGTKIHSSSFT